MVMGETAVCSLSALEIMTGMGRNGHLQFKCVWNCDGMGGNGRFQFKYAWNCGGDGGKRPFSV